MLIDEKFKQSGLFLFRWRGYLPLFFLGATFATQYFSHPARNGHFDDARWAAVCLLVGLAGILIRVLTVAFVPYMTSGRGTSRPYAERLNTSGMYSLMRNPVYFGNFFTFLAPVLFVRHFWLLILYLPVFALYHERIIFAEESFLREKFGREYEEWAKKTPIFFPDLSLWKRPDLPFSWKMAVRRECISVFTLVITIWALKIAEYYLDHQALHIEPSWLALFSLSGAVYLSVALIVQFSNRLDR
ncbi:MAG: isoprenylcysteine carboxylmethyltransferase family protein [Acidaminococcales bacterium]|jgi:protein-S-isoprenylcysteine O-methyltransferase Ste14|nr:isoprenylcysteine carboxylmethyltransferase family protein [Acidaminococcales bacterium]